MKTIPMLDLKLEYDYMKKDIDAAIARCLEHQQWIFGPEVKELEESIAKYIDVKHCIGVSSGTEALVLSLRAMAIKLKGKEYFDKTDEIITTPFTFTATGDAILRSGATPVFVDIDPATYNIDPANIRKYLTQNSGKVAGLLPVHLYGQACSMDELMAIAKEHELFVVEDIAQAFGGAWKSKKLGSIGATGCFSFFPSKNLGGFGDGGMISTNDGEISELIRMLLKHGGKDKYNVDHIGYNARLDTLQAAIVLAKFKYIDEFNDRRRKIAEKYNKKLFGIEGIILPYALSSSSNSELLSPNSEHTSPALSSSPSAEVDHVYHQYTIRVKDGKRGELQRFLKDKGVSTMVYYPFPLHNMNVFGEGRSKILGSLENSKQASDSVLSLPIEPLQKNETTESVVKAVSEFFR
jgi:dTDP-4-amino-4,6-dideoxygalactose transaminase